jgi:hypothetical protein
MVTGVAMHRGVIKPPPDKLVLISSFTERLIDAMQLKGVVNVLCPEH